MVISTVRPSTTGKLKSRNSYGVGRFTPGNGFVEAGKELEKIQVQSSYVNSYNPSSNVTEKLLHI